MPLQPALDGRKRQNGATVDNKLIVSQRQNQGPTALHRQPYSATSSSRDSDCCSILTEMIHLIRRAVTRPLHTFWRHPSAVSRFRSHPLPFSIASVSSLSHPLQPFRHSRAQDHPRIVHIRRSLFVLIHCIRSISDAQQLNFRHWSSFSSVMTRRAQQPCQVREPKLQSSILTKRDHLQSKVARQCRLTQFFFLKASLQERTARMMCERVINKVLHIMHIAIFRCFFIRPRRVT